MGRLVIDWPRVELTVSTPAAVPATSTIFLASADLHLDIEAQVLVDLQGLRLGLELGEAGVLGGHRVGADGEVNDVEAAVLIGGRRVSDTGLRYSSP